MRFSRPSLVVSLVFVGFMAAAPMAAAQEEKPRGALEQADQLEKKAKQMMEEGNSADGAKLMSEAWAIRAKAFTEKRLQSQNAKKERAPADRTTVERATTERARAERDADRYAEESKAAARAGERGKVDRDAELEQMKRHIGDIQVHLRDAKKMQDEDRVRLLTNELNQSKIELETAAGATNRGQVEVITARKKSMDEDYARGRDERDSELRAREEAKIRDDQKMRELRALGVPLEGRANEKAPARPRTPARIGLPITPEPPRDPHVMREPLGPHEPQSNHEMQALRSELQELRAAVESLRAEIEATRRAKR